MLFLTGLALLTLGVHVYVCGTSGDYYIWPPPPALLRPRPLPGSSVSFLVASSVSPLPFLPRWASCCAVALSVLLGFSFPLGLCLAPRSVSPWSPGLLLSFLSCPSPRPGAPVFCPRPSLPWWPAPLSVSSGCLSPDVLGVPVVLSSCCSLAFLVSPRWTVPVLSVGLGCCLFSSSSLVMRLLGPACVSSLARVPLTIAPSGCLSCFPL